MDPRELKEAVERAEQAEWEVADEGLDARPRLGYLPSRGVEPLEQQLAIAAKAAASPPPEPSYPPSVDLRATSAGNMITPIRDQEACGSCVAFGSSAAVEGTLKVEAGNPELEPDLSEAFLFYCRAAEEGRTCGGPTGGWYPKAALDVFSEKGGVPQEECFPYTAGDQECAACNDWEGQATTIAAWKPLHTPAEMKDWLATHGPIVGSMVVYEDFMHYAGGVYKHVTGEEEGGHCICIVGYDDEGEYWIAKNSWNTGWGEEGFFRIGYGECAIDSGALGVEGVNGPSGS
ncbi:MAG TPA: C1 family peptidase [Solirubrobacterales bacterium]|jgi:C1A family cysteine protease|nr:C1 family peptidase [Solirubrobacterales bacterium]